MPLFLQVLLNTFLNISPGISKCFWGPLRTERRGVLQGEEVWILESPCGGLAGHQGHLHWTAMEAKNKLYCVKGL